MCDGWITHASHTHRNIIRCFPIKRGKKKKRKEGIEGGKEEGKKEILMKESIFIKHSHCENGLPSWVKKGNTYYSKEQFMDNG